MSRYLALKFGYEGAHFSGFQRQPVVRTVEGDIRSVLFKLEKEMKGGEGGENEAVEGSGGKEGRASPGEGNPFFYTYASRTDKGVSALGNVLVLHLDTPHPDAPAIISYLNDSLELITFHSYADADETFNPRHASERRYRYIFPTVPLPTPHPLSHKTANDSVKYGISAFRKIIPFDLKLAQEAARVFVGTHDFSGFAKLEAGKDPMRSIADFTISLNHRIEGEPPMVVLEIRGESFLWMMVRFMIGGVLKTIAGDWTIEELRERLEKPDPRKKPSPVVAENLTLLEVVFPGITFTKIDGM